MPLVELIIIEKYTDVHFIKSILENEGIECFLWGEYLGGIDSRVPTYEAGGGIKINVKAEDYAKAKEVLDSISASFLNQNQIICPDCKSANINTNHKAKRNFVTRISAYFLGEAFCKCKDCGKEFKALL